MTLLHRGSWDVIRLDGGQGDEIVSFPSKTVVTGVAVGFDDRSCFREVIIVEKGAQSTSGTWVSEVFVMVVETTGLKSLWNNNLDSDIAR